MQHLSEMLHEEVKKERASADSDKFAHVRSNPVVAIDSTPVRAASSKFQPLFTFIHESCSNHCLRRIFFT